MTKKTKFIESMNILDGVVTWDGFNIDEKMSLAEQAFSLTEDMLQIEFGDRFTLDVGWRPDLDPSGHFVLVVVLDRDWMNPLLKKTCRSLSDLKKVIEDAAIFIHKAAKEKLPPRNVEYEDGD